MAVALGGVQTLLELIRTRSGHSVTVAEGMAVLGADGVRIGRLKRGNTTSMLVDRTLRRDIYVPFDFIDAVRDDGIVLTITADRVDAMPWPHPHLL